MKSGNQRCFDERQIEDAGSNCCWLLKPERVKVKERIIKDSGGTLGLEIHEADKKEWQQVRAAEQQWKMLNQKKEQQEEEGAIYWLVVDDDL